MAYSLDEIAPNCDALLGAKEERFKVRLSGIQHELRCSW